MIVTGHNLYWIVVGGYIRIIIFIHETNECDPLYFILNSSPLVLDHLDVDNVLYSIISLSLNSRILGTPVPE